MITMKGRTAVLLLAVLFTSSLISNTALHKAASIQIGSAGENSVETWAFNFTLRLPAVYICMHCLNISYLHPDHDPPPSLCLDFDPEQIPELAELTGNLFPIVPIGNETLEIEVMRTGDAISASFEFTHNYAGHLITADLNGSIVGDQVSFTITYHLPVDLQNYSMPLSRCDIMTEMEGSVNYTLPAELTGSYQGTLRGNRIDGAFNSNIEAEFAVWRFHYKEYVVKIDPFTGIQTRDYLWLNATAEWIFSKLRIRGYFTVHERMPLSIDGVFQPVQVVWQDDPIYGDNMTNIDFAVWSAGIPMVQGKNTLLFGYPYKDRNTISFTVVNNYTVKKSFTLEFRVMPDNRVIYESKVFEAMPGQTIIEIPAPIPYSDALEKPVPFEFKNEGEVRIEVEVVPASGSEPIESNNVTVHVKVKDTKRLTIYYVPIVLVDGTTGQPLHQPVSKERVNKHAEKATYFIQGTYPVAEDEIAYITTTPILINANEVLNATKPPWYINWGYVINRLDDYAAKNITGFKRVVGLVPDSNTQWVVTYDSDNWPGVVPYYKSNKNVVLVVDGWWDATAHEIGHTFGLWVDYPYDSEEYYANPPGYKAPGYWVNELSERYESTATCFMGESHYENYDNTWIDRRPSKGITGDYHWLLNKFAVQDPEVLFVSGLIWKNGTVQPANWYRLPTGAPDIPIGTNGNYSLVFLDNLGQVLGQVGYNVTFLTKEDEPREIGPAAFAFYVPYLAGTAKIQIVFNASVVAERVVSANSPAVTVAHPNGGEILDPETPTTITWDAYDLDGDPLTYMVEYSMNGDGTWIPLAVDLHRTSYVWNTTGFSLGDRYLVRVMATDAVNVGGDVSDGSFQVIPEFPSLLVLLLFMMLTLLTTVAYRRKRAREPSPC